VDEQVPFDCILIDVRIRGEYLVEVVESAQVDGIGVIHQQLLELQPVRDFAKAQHASIQHRVRRAARTH
jgi:hypothetical protein